jgi:hypothetical protein
VKFQLDVGIDYIFMEPAENILEIKIECELEATLEEILPVFKKWRHLRRLTLLSDFWIYPHEEQPPLKMVCDFALSMKHLTYLGIDICFGAEENPIFKGKVNDVVRAHRPDFIFEMPYSTSKPGRSSDEYWYHWSY